MSKIYPSLDILNTQAFMRVIVSKLPDSLRERWVQKLFDSSGKNTLGLQDLIEFLEGRLKVLQHPMCSAGATPNLRPPRSRSQPRWGTSGLPHLLPCYPCLSESLPLCHLFVMVLCLWSTVMCLRVFSLPSSLLSLLSLPLPYLLLPCHLSHLLIRPGVLRPVLYFHVFTLP